MLRVEEIIQKYNLKPHIEGGYAQLLYEDPECIPSEYLPCRFKGDRTFWNAIYFLLPKNTKSILHRINMTELWNFYLGDPLELYDISPEGELKKIVLGHDISRGEQLAYVFPRGHWIAAMPKEGSEFSFISCITAPGFTFLDWEKGIRSELLNKYPHLQETIIMLTD